MWYAVGTKNKGGNPYDRNENQAASPGGLHDPGAAGTEAWGHFTRFGGFVRIPKSVVGATIGRPLFKENSITKFIF